MSIRSLKLDAWYNAALKGLWYQLSITSHTHVQIKGSRDVPSTATCCFAVRFRNSYRLIIVIAIVVAAVVIIKCAFDISTMCHPALLL